MWELFCDRCKTWRISEQTKYKKQNIEDQNPMFEFPRNEFKFIESKLQMQLKKNFSFSVPFYFYFVFFSNWLWLDVLVLIFHMFLLLLRLRKQLNCVHKLNDTPQSVSFRLVQTINVHRHACTRPFQIDRICLCVCACARVWTTVRYVYATNENLFCHSFYCSNSNALQSVDNIQVTRFDSPLFLYSFPVKPITRIFRIKNKLRWR